MNTPESYHLTSLTPKTSSLCNVMLELSFFFGLCRLDPLGNLLDHMPDLDGVEGLSTHLVYQASLVSAGLLVDSHRFRSSVDS